MQGIGRLFDVFPTHLTDDKTNIWNHKKVCHIAKVISRFKKNIYYSRPFLKGRENKNLSYKWFLVNFHNNVTNEN